MMVMVMPAAVGEASVIVNGQAVAVIHEVESPEPFVGFDGVERTGRRWLPQGVAKWIEGPVTTQDAALLALAMAGYDHAESAKALGYDSKPGKNGHAA